MFTASQCEMVTPILRSFGWEFWAGIVFTVAVICASLVWFFSGKNDEVVASRKVNLEHRSDVDVISNDPILEPKHKIFLSHSGVQKEFAELLCLALESRCHYPFFDKRPSSLPKGEKFANLIFEAVAQCKVLVVVVSDDYFMSKWPMMELHAFVQAIEAMNDRPANAKSKYILPLFYKLSIEEFRDTDRREKWAKEWKKLAKEGGTKRGIDVNAWMKAVEVLGSYNDISYNRELQEIKAYYDEIVSHICGIIKVLCKNIESVGLTEKYKCKIVGIFGVGGIGKTTVCKTLCNELSDEYEGRVCHIELEAQAKTLILVESLRKLVILLTNKNSEFVQNLDEGQCTHVLRNSGISRRTFIAIDNVWDNHESVMQAKTILDALKFHEGSLVIVTARSQSILNLFGIHGEACVEMPELGETDATKLFLYHAMGGKQFGTMEERRDILECIQRCYFSKGGGSGFHYYPLALKSLGIQANFIGEKSSEWVEMFSRVRNFNHLGGGNPVFDILRSSFDMLRPYERSLFMDLVIYRPFSLSSGCDFQSHWADMVEWLCLVHRVTEDAIKSRLDSLMQKGLLQDVDWTSGRINVHDLYLEFASMELEGLFNESIDFEHWRCIRTSIPDSTELERSPSGGCWQNLNRVSIHDMKGYHQAEDRITSLEVINWQFYSNVVVLELEYIVYAGGSLNLEGMNCLRSLYINEVEGLERVEGLDGLRNLAFFKWFDPDRLSKKVYDNYTSIVGQLPTSLKVFDLRVRICLNPDMLVRCSNLVKLKLVNIQAVELKLSSCSKLQRLRLIDIEKLHTLCLPSNLSGVCGLKFRKVQYCNDLVNIQGLEEYIGLEQLRIWHCPRYKLPDLRNVTKLQILQLARGEEVVGCCIPSQLRELYYECLESNKVSSLRGCKKLELLDLHVGGVLQREETNLKDLEYLPALRHLTLNNCRISSGWPDLSKSRKLEVIRIGYLVAEMELQEDDICMLMSLPLLQPLQIGKHAVLVDIKLDLHRRKVLRLNSSTGCWKECDFDIPPIKLNDLRRRRFST